MKPLKVKILSDGTAKEVNQSTNRKMGKRHIAFESMLRTFVIDNLFRDGDNPTAGEFIPNNWTGIHDAEILPNGKIKIL